MTLTLISNGISVVSITLRLYVTNWLVSHIFLTHKTKWHPPPNNDNDDEEEEKEEEEEEEARRIIMMR